MSHVGSGALEIFPDQHSHLKLQLLVPPVLVSPPLCSAWLESCTLLTRAQLEFACRVFSAVQGGGGAS